MARKSFGGKKADSIAGVCKVLVDDPFGNETSEILDVVVGVASVMGVVCVSTGTVPCAPTICCCCFMMDCCSDDISSATEALLASGWTVVPGDFPGGGLLDKERDVGTLGAVLMPWVFSKGLWAEFCCPKRLCMGPLVDCGGEVMPSGRVATPNPLLCEGVECGDKEVGVALMGEV